MKRFLSYGPVDPRRHFHVPREKLIEKAYTHLVGENPEETGHYITVWAPRQTGKTWAMREILQRIKKNGNFECGLISLELLKKVKKEKDIAGLFTRKLSDTFERRFPAIRRLVDIPPLFTKQYFQKPVILLIDEFDALEEEYINSFAGIFRDMHLSRGNQMDKSSGEKTCLLHSLGLIGVRSVLGIENVKGSPFNVQRSLHIPNLTSNEVKGLFREYREVSGKEIEPEVIQRLYEETRGQPGLTCWFGELMSEGFEGFRPDEKRPLSLKDFGEIRAAAVYDLPNTNIINIISKAKEEPYRQKVLELFRTDDKHFFSFDEPLTNYLYMHGVVDREIAASGERYIRFASPFVQKRLFNYFSRELFTTMGRLVEPFLNLEKVITPTRLDIRELLKLYQSYIDTNRDWLFKDAPRRSDLRVFEAVFHFNLFMYLEEFLRTKKGRVFPEFPTGNGKIDLLVRYAGRTYGIELKSYVDQPGYRSALRQAAKYAKQLQLEEIHIAFFVEYIDEANREIHETDYRDETTGITVKPVFIATGK